MMVTGAFCGPTCGESATGTLKRGSSENAGEDRNRKKNVNMIFFFTDPPCQRKRRDV